MGKIDDLARALSRHAPEPQYRGFKDAAEEIYASEGAGWRLAEDLLYSYPEALGRLDQIVGDRGLELGRKLGAGAESLVWEVRPRSGGDASALKVRVGDASPTDFRDPDDVPGVVPYFAQEQVSPGVASAMQPLAKAVYKPKRGLEVPFSRAAERVAESLLSRGWYWGDNHKWNIGAMPDGTWGAIDGFIHSAHPDWKLPDISPEESIRMLRLTPDEMLQVYGAP
jgi:hypothetical protein